VGVQAVIVEADKWVRQHLVVRVSLVAVRPLQPVRSIGAHRIQNRIACPRVEAVRKPVFRAVEEDGDRREDRPRRHVFGITLRLADVGFDADLRPPIRAPALVAPLAQTVVAGGGAISSSRRCLISPIVGIDRPMTVMISSADRPAFSMSSI
jgi:hypothetical protein